MKRTITRRTEITIETVRITTIRAGRASELTSQAETTVASSLLLNAVSQHSPPSEEKHLVEVDGETEVNE